VTAFKAFFAVSIVTVYIIYKLLQKVKDQGNYREIGNRILNQFTHHFMGRFSIYEETLKV